MVKEKMCDIIDGVSVKYHANGKTIWSKGCSVNGEPDGYWEWYRVDGTLKRSGYFDLGKQVKTWITYDARGQVHKVTEFPTSGINHDK